MGKYKHSKVMDFLNIWDETEIYKNHNDMEQVIPISRKKCGSTKYIPKLWTSQNIPGKIRIHEISKSWKI